VVCAIEAVDSIVYIGACVGVNNIDDHEKAKSMCLVNEVFKVIRVTLARTGGEVARHMIAK